jgi:hypothetical protein
MKRLFLVFPIGLWALPIPMPLQTTDPWLGDAYAFRGRAQYGYGHYSNVKDAKVPLKSASNDQLLAGAFGWCLEKWDVETAAEFVHTPRQPWGYRAAAVQVRRLFLDDVACDPVSFMMGCIAQNTNSRSLKDVSCPYHANFNLEFNGAVGKEWCLPSGLFLRSFAFFGIGTGNRGYPWARAKLSIQGRVRDHHQGELFALGYFGFGHKQRVNTDHFYGWAKFGHESLDIGLSYRYFFDCWGDLALDLTCRPFTRVFPEELFAIFLTYTLPFSLL